MDDKLGRNDLCHCGSGKKYKKCCMAHDDGNFVVIDFELQKLRKTEGEIIDEHLLPYVEQVLTKDLEEYVWSIFAEDCNNWPMEAIAKLYDHMFIPWFLFNWVNDPLDHDINTNLIKGKTIAENYLIINRNKLSKYQISFMEAMNKTYYSFYIIENVILDEKLILKDVFLDKTHIIKEKSATHYLQKDNIIFTRILTLDDQSISIGMAPYIISKNSLGGLLESKKRWKQGVHSNLTPELLRTEYDYDLLNEYFMIINQNFEVPFIRNSDGEDIIFYTLHYNLYISTNEAFNKLLALTEIEAKEQLLSDAQKDNDGNITYIEFPWLKEKEVNQFGSTILGHIIIKNGKLIAKVNSEERKNALELLLKNYLGSVIDTPKICIETIQQNLNSSKENSEDKFNNNINNDDFNDDFEDMTEITDYIKNLTDRYWEEWFDIRIPALGNRTPKEATKTQEGRELLESLLEYYEQENKNQDNGDNNEENIFKPNITYLRSKLNM